jgi:hypothetical protein
MRRVRLVLGRLLLVRRCSGAPALENAAVIVEAVVDAIEPPFEGGPDHHPQDPHVLEHAVLALGDVEERVLRLVGESRRGAHRRALGAGHQEHGARSDQRDRRGQPQGARPFRRAQPRPSAPSLLERRLRRTRREPRLRLDQRMAAQRRHDLLHRLAQRAAVVAAAQVLGELGPQHDGERALEVVREQLLRALAADFVAHCASRNSERRPSSRRASSMRPRLMRLFTVPSGSASVSAISS